MGKLDLFHFDVDSRENRSATLTEAVFYSHVVVAAEHLLLFQANSILCANVGEYLGYDYVRGP